MLETSRKCKTKLYLFSDKKKDIGKKWVKTKKKKIGWQIGKENRKNKIERD